MNSQSDQSEFARSDVVAQEYHLRVIDALAAERNWYRQMWAQATGCTVERAHDAFLRASQVASDEGER